MSGFDLGKYWDLFDDALEERYNNKFKIGFARIETLFQEVRPGRSCRDITVDDVLQIFASDLPYIEDWTKPDHDDLAKQMAAHNAAKLIRSLSNRGYDTALIGEIRHCFRELGLTALILHHVYPERFAVCSHHLASLLFVAGSTVPEFYVDYCEELTAWSQRVEPRRRQLTVVETEFALWTWYWFTYHSRRGDARRKHLRTFLKDPWVQDRRAKRIAYSLKRIEKLDLARSYLDTEPTVAAIIAWREFETELRHFLGDVNSDMGHLIDRVGPGTLPVGWTRDNLAHLWFRTGPGRNRVMHRGEEISTRDAAALLDWIVGFVEHNRPA